MRAIGRRLTCLKLANVAELGIGLTLGLAPASVVARLTRVILF